MDIEKLIKDKQAVIVDVRTTNEFSGGHVVDSINIPLQEIGMRLDEIKEMKEPLVLCCASGNRSGIAAQWLSSQGVMCFNGGSWLDVNFFQSQIL
ncbi:MAG: rhodanese-like domain-containing protein [Flavobacteriaceae bacterium CG_4_8_14_3_um_filter_34_10]|nr:rhodanese-like domain-containing protein [Flavobacteriia bacterium]OIP49855.1 MAG: sulfurtransferase [Flavobacteriaceae bacterium CG2_30_34_30]PIQ18919.1 MAG: sulfurtransferase [Flavobacteriaceae bacterium CG18_big_fil_WC_8_21_14_2_50_34_36]PIV48972.1 MAG: rhodanese-like domain-containing protein [Flavobacteriaceae bacterium CG02_land_8_20_14_3_00_34_13]PIX10506.1 MAG: rhodanese-like domain-containing protein [Flavobacteriaceae bacterium CG_4_8_14_3_um_filter_34_10]PJC08221.1 MAG: rhodanese